MDAAEEGRRLSRLLRRIGRGNLDDLSVASRALRKKGFRMRAIAPEFKDRPGLVYEKGDVSCSLTRTKGAPVGSKYFVILHVNGRTVLRDGNGDERNVFYSGDFELRKPIGLREPIGSREAVSVA